jgi:hypothetical protein
VGLMWGIREQIRDAIARAQPRTTLAELLWRAGCPALEANGAAESAFYHMRKPGRAGVKATINFHYIAPPESRSRILAEMFENKVHPSGFGAVLARDWVDGSFRTVAAAGTRERLLAWFGYARFDLPFIARFCSVEALPARTTVWRGGRGEAAAVTDGLSWSPSRELAAYYANRMWSAWGHTGEPVLHRREISRDQAVAFFIDQGGEVVLDGSGPYEIDTVNPEEIAALAASVEQKVEIFEKERERIKAEFMAASEDELFGEWAG